MEEGVLPPNSATTTAEEAVLSLASGVREAADDRGVSEEKSSAGDDESMESMPPRLPAARGRLPTPGPGGRDNIRTATLPLPRWNENDQHAQRQRGANPLPPLSPTSTTMSPSTTGRGTEPLIRFTPTPGRKLQTMRGGPSTHGWGALPPPPMTHSGNVVSFSSSQPGGRASLPFPSVIGDVRGYEDLVGANSSPPRDSSALEISSVEGGGLPGQLGVENSLNGSAALLPHFNLQS